MSLKVPSVGPAKSLILSVPPDAFSTFSIQGVMPSVLTKDETGAGNPNLSITGPSAAAHSAAVTVKPDKIAPSAHAALIITRLPAFVFAPPRPNGGAWRFLRPGASQRPMLLSGDPHRKSTPTGRVYR